MDMNIDQFSVLISLGMFVIAVLTLNRGSKKIDSEQITAITSLKMDLKYIKEDLTEIKQTITKIDEMESNTTSEIAGMKRDIKTLFNNYNQIQRRLDNEFGRNKKENQKY